MTPNKKANSGALPDYRALKDAARAAGTHYLYEATVGAGLPVIQTLRDLRETGDDITRIEGIFSGTLAYLFNVFDGSESFSSIVRTAKQKGYTEPDPRDDLSGMDVARKLIILGREMGLTLEMADVEVVGLVPPALDGCGVEEFMERLPEFDAVMADALKEAKKAGQVLRYVGRVDADGKATVRLTRLDASACIREHRAHRQRGPICDAQILRQSADRSGTGRRARGHRRGRVRGLAAAFGLPWSAPVSLMHADVVAFAPATVANVGIGFDILGHTVEAVGDRVRLRRIDEPVVRIRAVTGIAGDLPVEPGSNTAGRALQAMRAALGSGFRFRNRDREGHSPGLGHGRVRGFRGGRRGRRQRAHRGSGAAARSCSSSRWRARSSRAAPCTSTISLLACSAGSVLTVGIDHPRVKQIPVPASIRCVLVHPHMHLGTREARAVLKSDVTRSDFVWQTANLAGFISGCYSNDLDMIRDSFNDVIIEPQRQKLIPGFKDVQRSAMSEGALGCSISGAGPAIFAWAEIQNAEGVRAAMTAAFTAHGLESDSWISSLDNAGARVVDA